jgi:UPF0755 protein
VRKFLAVVLLLAVVGAGVVGTYMVLAPAGPTVEQFVVIPTGSSATRIGRILEDQGIIRNRYAFDAWRLFKRGTLKAGEYRFDHPVPLTEVYGRLVRGDVYTVTVTIPEGYNVFDIAKTMEEAKLHTAKEFIAGATANVGLVKDLDQTAPTLEGYLFPETYKFPPAWTVKEMQAAMVKEFRRKAQALGITGAGTSASVHDVVTLASLVEKETGVASERGAVASVFENRMARGMPLETDPSVIYAALLEGKYQGVITMSELRSPSPYNTYTHTGLPPGPIANPGVDSLRAALHPPTTGYLYFVADAAGHSRFATSLKEHNSNVEQYRKAVREGNGR